MSDPITAGLASQGVLILDGGLATELEYRGADLADPLWSAKVLLDEPERVRTVHEAYLEAGADVIASASYQATFEGLAARGLDAAASEALLRSSVELALEARDAVWARHRTAAPGTERLRPLVAASVGPYGAFLADGSEYRGDYGLDVEALSRFHRRRLEVLAGSGADVLALETIPSYPEALALARLLDESSGPVAWISFSCRDEATLHDGTDLVRVVAEIEGCRRIAAVGVNCTAPSLVTALLRRAATVTAKPLVAYPNSGEGWDAVTRSWQAGETAPGPAEACSDWHRSGARLVGGCCRTRPADIRALRRVLLG